MNGSVPPFTGVFRERLCACHLVLFSNTFGGYGKVGFSPEMIVFIISILTALLVSSFCSLMESVLLSLSPVQIAEISEKTPKVGAIWSEFKKNIDRPISAILILNTTAHTIGATVAGNALASLTGASGHQKAILLGFSIAFTFLMLQYTEILPKTLGVRYNKALARWLVHPLSWMIWIVTPISVVTRWFNRPFEPKGHKVEYASAVDELRYMATLARQNRQIGTLQEEIIVAAARLSRQTAFDVMIPLEDVVFLSNELSLEEAIEAAYIDAHTRYPVYKGVLDNNHEGIHEDNVVGYVNFKEIISYKKMNSDAHSFNRIVRPIPIVDAAAPASDLLRLFTMKHEHLAMIRDKNRNCVGMVTLEDIIEELVGELEDEFDSLPTQIHILHGQVLLLGGGCLMHKVRRLITHNVLHLPLDKGRDFASEKDDPMTLDEWLEDRIGRVPRRGDQIILNGVEFNVRRVRRGHVFDVQIRKNDVPKIDELDEGTPL